MESQDPQKKKCREITAIAWPQTVAGLQLIFSQDFRWVEKILSSKYKRKRRPPHPPVAMFKALLYMLLKQIPSWRKLESTLKADHDLTLQLGFPKPPCYGSFSEFAMRIGDETLNEVFLAWVKRIRKDLPDLGTNVLAVDGTLVSAYARPRPRNRPKTDPDAAWGVTRDKYGKKVYVYGYKIHVMSDPDYELPLTITVTPGNKHEMAIFPTQLKQLLSQGIHPRVLIADAGYDSKRNTLLCLKHGIKPVIAINPRRTGRKKRRADYLLPIQRDSKEWNDYYGKRAAAERIFSRLKLELGLKNLKRRTLARARFHFTMCLIAMLVVAQASYSTGQPDLSRSIEKWRY